MDILKKELAPITSKAWDAINDEAKNVLNNVLSARKFVDVSGPHGWDKGAVSLGRLTINDKGKGNVKYGVNQVQPLIEARVQFELNIWELDNIIRGEENIDLNPVRDAAKSIAEFEENAIYQGFKEGNIEGLKASSEHHPLHFPDHPDDWLKEIATGMNEFKNVGVSGPFSLVLSEEKWGDIISHMKGGYPFQNVIKSAIGGSIIVSPFLKNGGYMISEKDGSFELTLGSDFAIGYENHNSKTVQLFITESFTFRVLDPTAVIVIK